MPADPITPVISFDVGAAIPLTAATGSLGSAVGAADTILAIDEEEARVARNKEELVGTRMMMIWNGFRCVWV